MKKPVATKRRSRRASPKQPARVPSQKQVASNAPNSAAEWDQVTPDAGHDIRFLQVELGSPFRIQAKMKVNQPGDREEQEADQMADEVMRKVDVTAAQRDGSATSTNTSSEPKSVGAARHGVIQRQTDDEADADEMLQAKECPGGTRDVSEPVRSQIISMRGGGRPIESRERTFFESRMGADFANVRIHADRRASDTARRLNARAFTIGNDIVFGAGQYQPGVDSGKRLLAHELTHVLQQRSGRRSGNQIARKREGPGVPFPEGVKYLKHLREKKKIKGTVAGRRTAAKIVREFWTKGYPHFVLSPLLKTLIIEELLQHLKVSKILDGMYQDAITLLIEGTGKSELNAIFTRIVRKEVTKALAKPRLKRVEAHEKKIAGEPAPSLEVFSADKLLDLRDSFLANAQKPKKPKKAKPASKWRKVCIEILESELARVFKGDKGEKGVKSAIKKSGSSVKDSSGTVLAAHSVENLMHRMTKGSLVVSKFKTDYDRKKDPSGKRAKIPKAKMKDSAWKWVVKKVGKQIGWHIFAGSASHGLHSFTVFVENRPGNNIFLYFSDQNWTGVPKFLKKGSGSMAGFRRYHGESGFDRFLDALTFQLWEGAWDRKVKSLKKANPKKTYTKNELYAKANFRTTLSLWKLARKTKGSPFSVPAKAAATTPTKSKTSTSSKPGKAGPPFDYVVRDGDSLGVIAVRYGTSVAEIQKLNGMKKDETTIFKGKTIKVPTPPNTYIFQKGDKLKTIASKHKTTEKKLLELNNIKKEDVSKIKHQDPIKVR